MQRRVEVSGKWYMIEGDGNFSDHILSDGPISMEPGRPYPDEHVTVTWEDGAAPCKISSLPRAWADWPEAALIDRVRHGIWEASGP